MFVLLSSHISCPHLWEGLGLTTGLFVRQEMAAPELQRLALEAKSAAAILKYLPATVELLPQVVETLTTLSAHPLWPARAAALVFVQVRGCSSVTHFSD